MAISSIRSTSGAILLLLSLTTCGVVGNKIPNNLTSAGGMANTQTTPPPVPWQAKTNTPVTVNHQGINFLCPAQLASSVEIVKHDAVPLKNKDDKPDYVHPKYISFLLTGQYAESHTASDFAPEISIFPVTEYIAMYAASVNEQHSVRRSLQSLQSLLAQGSFRPGDKIVHGVWIEGSNPFYIQVKFIKFKNGSGIRYVTQFNNEPRLISNQGLVYIFQGLSNDKKYFIWGTFPIGTPSLPETTNIPEHNGYNLPEYFYDPQHRTQNEVAYKEYITKVGSSLSTLMQYQFVPNLSQFDNLMSSIEVRNEDK